MLCKQGSEVRVPLAPPRSASYHDLEIGVLPGPSSPSVTFINAMVPSTCAWVPRRAGAPRQPPTAPGAPGRQACLEPTLIRVCICTDLHLGSHDPHHRRP